MRLPPDDSDDITPAESMIKTVDLGSMPTREIGTIPTIKLDAPESFAGGASRVMDVHTLVRARAGAREQAFEECKRSCRSYALSYRRGLMTGALATALVMFAAAWGAVIIQRCTR